MSLEQAGKDKDIEKQKDEELLIAGLVALATEIRQAKANWSKWQYEKIIKSALSQNPNIKTFHQVRELGWRIQQLQAEKKLPRADIPMQVISDLLKAGSYAPLESSSYSLISFGRSKQGLFASTTPMSNRTKLGIGLGAISVTAFLGITLAATLSAKTTVAAATTLAVTATASAAFPPALMGLIAIGITAALLTAMILAIAAIKYYHNKHTREAVNNLPAERTPKRQNGKA